MAEQDPDMFEEFVIDEEEEAPSNRPFMLAAGSLLGIMVVALLCLGIYQIFFDGDGGEAQQVADNSIAATATSISATNEAIETQNAFVTQTLVAMEMTANAPTSTPTPEPTATFTPQPTATPTNTPVVQTDDGEALGEGEDANAAATSIFSGENTVTPDSGGTTAGDINASNANTAETLPETGISVWGWLTAALGLFMVILVARRLRIES